MAVQSITQHNLDERFLSRKYTPEFLQSALIARADFHPYPTIEDRAAWASLPEAVRQAHLRYGEKAQQAEWPHLPATLYLQYQRVGNRRNFERPHFERRDLLVRMTLAECIENQGRFMDSIADAIWGVCEELSWCLPAHISHQKAGVDLPDTTEPVVDLFAAETGALIAWVDYLLGARLDQVSPLIRARMQREVQQRILDPALARDDFWWMGFGARRVNNWNPWINSNWLAAALLMEPDRDRRVAAVWKILESLDRFITPYPKDGGCDEGPGYWGRAGASLFDNLDLLYAATGGKLDEWNDPLVQDIGRFVYRAHIAGEYYVNFADAPARLIPDPLLVFRYGQRINDPLMTRFGAWLADHVEVRQEGVTREGDVAASLTRVLPALFHLDELDQVAPEPPLVRDAWLPEIEVMVARDQAGTTAGYYLAAKGGHNEESHNHNDIGQYIVYIDGLPVIIDAGVETYTRKTFSSQRYEIWTMQSAYHSLPTIDGVMQAPGRAFAAREVRYSVDDAQASLSLDIAAAYPAEAGLKSWQRSVTLKRGQQVSVTDQWALNKAAQEITFNLVTPCLVDLSQPGVASLRQASLAKDRPSGAGQVRYDGQRLAARSEEITISDERLLSVWGQRLTRIVFTLLNPEMEGETTFQIVKS